MQDLSDLEYLETLTENELPGFVAGMSPEQVVELRSYVQDVVDQQNAGMDKLFESMAVGIKYMPNFILVSIVKQFVEPPIAARIAATLELKDVLSLANNLEVEYLGEASVHMSTDWITKITGGLKSSLQGKLVIYMAEKHPMRALDIAGAMPEKFKKSIAEHIDLTSIDESKIISESRKNTLHELQVASRDGQ